MRQRGGALSALLVLTIPVGALGQAHDGLPARADFSFPPEWAPHEAVWMGWSYDTTHHATQVALMKEMLPHVPIRLMVVSDSARSQAHQMLVEAGAGAESVQYIVNEVPNFWTRDPGPLFLSNGRSLAIAAFRWNDFGYPNELRATSDPRLLRRGEIGHAIGLAMDLPVVATQVVAEGGGLEVSSDVILTYRETAIQRNPGVTLEDIEREYLRLYGKKKVVWLSRSPLADRVFSGPKLGNYFGFGANGHIDEYARFVNDSTILIAQIDSADAAADPLSAADRRILLENLAELRSATRPDGRPFHIITLPVPALHDYMWTGPLPQSAKARDAFGAWFRDYEAGDEINWIPAVSYLNFFITNGVVLVSRYWQEGLPEREREKDEEVRSKLQQLFPERRVVQIHAMAVNWSGGGIHCITQQQPRLP
jgi:agmatine deiminase